MIGMLRGTVFQVEETGIILDVMGVGYRVGMSASGIGEAAGAQGEMVVLTHTHVREDALELFGFVHQEELDAFRVLIGISGIGPRLAMQILGAISPSALGMAVATEDMKTLKGLPGIGKKTAERLIVELRDKPLGSGGVAPSTPAVLSGKPDVFGEIRSAMENLGYRGAKLERALQVMEQNKSNWDLEEGIREALFLLR